MKPVIRIGTRGSRLALAQSGQIQKILAKQNPGLRFELVVVKTLGDEFQSVALFKKTNVGVFTKAIEKKLLKGDIDVAVHSLKDLPTTLPKGLVLAAVPRRLDSSDVLLTRNGTTLAGLPLGATVGTGSPRRKRQLQRLRPDLDVRDLRGNLDTRVSKVLKEKKLDAIVVAGAGLMRLNKYRKHAQTIPPSEFLPAVGQAALALQARRSDSKVLRLLKRLHDEKTGREVGAERSLLAALHGGCRVPLGVYCKVSGRGLKMKAAVFSTRSSDAVYAEASGRSGDGAKIARQLAVKLLKQGAGRFMKEARNEG